MNGQYDSQAHKDYPEMKWKSTLVRTWILLTPGSVFIGARWWRFLPHMVILESRLKGSTILWLYHLEHTVPLSSHQEGKSARISHTHACVLQSESQFTRTYLLVTNYRVDCSYYLNAHISSFLKTSSKRLLLLWDNSIPFRHSIELKSSNFWIHNSPYIRCEYSLSWSETSKCKNTSYLLLNTPIVLQHTHTI